MTPVRALILATSDPDGVEYANALGIADFRVAVPGEASRIEGLRIRAVVVSPDFAYALIRQSMDPDSPAYDLLRVATRNAAMAGAPRG